MAIDGAGRGSEGAAAPVKKVMKRKRVGCTSAEEREVVVGGLEEEMEGLFRYYKEVLGTKVEGMELDRCGTSSGLIACLLEESELPMSKLVEYVFEKLKEREGVSVTMATVKSSVVLLGQRMAYGIVNEDADVLEDETASCLWCWETRDIKMLPKSARMMLKVRRTCRKKIHERITAVSGFLSVLRNPESDSISKSYLMKRSEKLCKVLNEADIRLLVDSMIQKNDAELSQKEAMQEEKLIAKKLKMDKLGLEKEKKRMDRETQKEKSLHEKEQKRLQEKAEKQWEKEEIETKKQQKRLQDEAEKEQRRREKEDAELRKQIALKKQASLMERFLKKRKINCTDQNDQPSTDVSFVSTVNSSEQAPESIIQSIDKALARSIELSTTDLQKAHIDAWHSLGQYIRSNRKQHWGLRRRPRTELIKEIKLSNCKDIACDNDSSDIKLLNSLEDSEADKSKNNVAANNSVHCEQKGHRRRQLLQFDKSFRPAFYGYWPKKSNIIGPRHPFNKDPDLDYDVDSDEEWEEEEPGESLSDCEKDEEDDSLEAGNGKGEEEDESEDDFFVPDGYLSENEGVQDRLESDSSAEGIVSSSCQTEENEEIRVLLRQHKHLQNLTEQALRKNQPMFILNLMHEKDPQLNATDLSGIRKVEHMCLQALSMCLFPGHSQIEISVDDEIENEIVENSPNGKAAATLRAVESAISDADLPKFVSAIQSSSQGMTKVVERLQQIFPCVPKSFLKTKVRQLSDFVDNRWQVKKEVLDDLGLAPPSGNILVIGMC
uniref:Chromatin assembly factor 1 subunit FAS1 n=1 Tax=Kalanchoe fedtschenkoi TaxID=63787 RepID=A0A7N0TBS5_KALFE